MGRERLGGYQIGTPVHGQTRTRSLYSHANLWVGGGLGLQMIQNPYPIRFFKFTKTLFHSLFSSIDAKLICLLLVFRLDNCIKIWI